MASKLQCDSFKLLKQVSLTFSGEMNSRQGLLQQFIVCNNCMQSPALFQNIFKFCIFLPKFSNILPLFNIFKYFSPFFCPFSEKSHACPDFLEQALMVFPITIQIKNSQFIPFKNASFPQPASIVNKIMRCKNQFLHLLILFIMFIKLLVILFIIKLYARNYIFKTSFTEFSCLYYHVTQLQ